MSLGVRKLLVVVTVFGLLSGCGGNDVPADAGVDPGGGGGGGGADSGTQNGNDAGGPFDGGVTDAGPPADAGVVDAGGSDSGVVDGGPTDAGGLDGSVPVATDAGPFRLEAYTFFGNFNDVTTGPGGSFLAVGDDGVTARSADGREWQFSFAQTRQNLTGVTYFQGGGGRYLATGNDGGLFNSVDGVDWTVTEKGLPALYDVTASQTIAVAVGRSRSFYSTDGVTWDAGVGIPLNQDFVSIAHGNGKFYALNRAWRVMRSSDGINFGSDNSVCIGGGEADEMVFNRHFYAAGVDRLCDLGDGGANTSGNDIFAGTGGLAGVASDGTRVVAMGNIGDFAVGNTASIAPVRRFNDTTVRAMAYELGNWVAVGEAGLLMHSTDGLNWTEAQRSANARAVGSVVHGNGVFVGSGNGFGAGTNPLAKVLVSSNGRDWVFSRPFRRVDFAGGLFFGHQTDGIFETSTDGLNWSAEQSFGRVANFLGVQHGNGRYVAVGNDVLNGFRPVFGYSEDGGSWTFVDAGVTTGTYTSLRFGGGKFVAGGIVGAANNTILSSSDGVVWEKSFLDGGGSATTVPQIAYGNGVFVIPHPVDGRSRVSPDGINWIAYPQPLWSGGNTGAVHFGDGQFVAATNNKVDVSADGITWVRLDGGMTSAFTIGEGVFGNGLHVFPNRLAGASVQTSADLRDAGVFTYNPNAEVTAVLVYDGGIFGSTEGGTLLFRDGTRPMEIEALGKANGLTQILRKDATLVALTRTNVMKVSQNGGDTFTDVVLPIAGMGATEVPVPLAGTVFNGSFFVTGENMYVFSSPDGSNWTPGGFANGPVLFSGGGKIVGARGFGTIRYSTDGTTFTAATPLSRDESPNSGAFGNGAYVIVGDDGEISRSPDAITWTIVKASTGNGTPDLEDVTWTGNQFVAVGGQGLLFTSPDGTTWTQRLMPLINFETVEPTAVPNEVLLGGSKGFIGKLRL